IVQYFCTIYVLKIICLKSLISRTYVTLRTADSFMVAIFINIDNASSMANISVLYAGSNLVHL
ncbi:hypothetical protein C0J52_10425, partial [Blattella germanica]